MPQKRSIIAAHGENLEIGMQGKLPWDIIPEDLKRFKTLTTGNPVIMGRKTLQSILRRNRKPLEGRQNIVLTRDTQYQPQSRVLIARSMEEAFDLARTAEEVFFIGGEQIYATALPSLATHMYLTQIHREFPQADTFFPAFNPGNWRITNTDPRGNYTFVDYERTA